MVKQMNLFEQFPIRTPCDKRCDCEWCSFECFIRRGYIWDKSAHSWVYDGKGKAVRAKNRKCDWKTKGEE